MHFLLFSMSVVYVFTTSIPEDDENATVDQLRVWGCRAVVRLPDPKLKTLGERGIECIFVGYVEQSKAFRFFVIEPNESVLINSVIESRDAVYDENRFFSIPRPSLRIRIGAKDIGVSMIPEEVTKEMDVKTTFLNGELDEEVYMNQPQGFIMPGNENKVCKLIKSLYGLKQAPKQWHQKFDKVGLSSGYLLNQADNCVYSKFDESGKGVIICLYVDDMLIFGTDQVQVDLTKEFLSSRFSMKDMEEADVILVSTPMDTSEKMMPNNGQVVSQLEYSRVIGCRMYAMTCTRPGIAFVVGKLILEGYTDVIWISNTEDSSSTSDWVFLLGRGVISWVSKKQTCITGSTIESEFAALAAAGAFKCLKTCVYFIFRNCIELGRIVENLVQLWVQFISGNMSGVSSLTEWYSSDGFSFVLPKYTKESSMLNIIMTVFHVVFFGFIIIAGICYGNTDNLIQPQGLAPYGVKGVIDGAAIVYFSYIGYDSVSTMAEEIKNPSKSLPLGIVGSVLIVSVIYCLMALSLCMMVPYNQDFFN
nr:zinc finger, CCHC-type [Tanacetum cinerariifolium]